MRLPVLFARMTLVRWAARGAAVRAAEPRRLDASSRSRSRSPPLLAGLSTTAAVYLITERLLRPAFALALDPSAPPEARSLGIGPRLLLDLGAVLRRADPHGRADPGRPRRDRPEGPDRADLVRGRRGAGRGLHRHEARHPVRRAPGARAAARDRRGLQGDLDVVGAGRRRLRGRAPAGRLQRDGRRAARARAAARPLRPPGRRRRRARGARARHRARRRDARRVGAVRRRRRLDRARPAREPGARRRAAQRVLRRRRRRRPRARRPRQQVRGRRRAVRVRRAGRRRTTTRRARSPARASCAAASTRSTAGSTPRSASPAAPWWPATSAPRRASSTR